MSKQQSKTAEIPLNKVVIARVQLEGISPISFGRHHETPKLSADESPDAYESRCFLQKAHITEAGELILTPMMIKKTIDESAGYLSLSIPGKGSAKYTKNFLAGLLVMDSAPLTWAGKPITTADVRREVFFVSSTGKSGSGSRVKRHFPTVDKWQALATIHILDGTITTEVFERVVISAGRFIGVGRFRPRNGGYYGRFNATSFAYETLIG